MSGWDGACYHCDLKIDFSLENQYKIHPYVIWKPKRKQPIPRAATQVLFAVPETTSFPFDVAVNTTLVTIVNI